MEKTEWVFFETHRFLEKSKKKLCSVETRGVFYAKAFLIRDFLRYCGIIAGLSTHTIRRDISGYMKSFCFVCA
jgi:hypothetical protein